MTNVPVGGDTEAEASPSGTGMLATWVRRPGYARPVNQRPRLRARMAAPFRLRLSAATALAALTLAAGCGGWDAPAGAPSDGGGTAAPAPGGTAPPSGQPSEPPSESPSESGRELRAGDFLLEQGPETAGFTAEDSDRSDYTDFPEQEFADCLGVPVELVQDRSMQTAIGQLFLDEITGMSLSSTSAIVSEEVLQSDLDIVSRPEYPGCAAEFASRLLLEEIIADLGEGSGISIEIVQATSIPPPAGATARLSLVMSVSDATGALFEIYYDVISIFEGRVEATIYANSVDPLDEEIISAATAQVVEKVQNQ